MDPLTGDRVIEVAAIELQKAADYSQQLSHLRELLEKDTIRADEGIPK